jgi:hypothetical protein
MPVKPRNKEIINRCRLACKKDTLQEFAALIGVSKQILSAATKLKKPPQTIVCKTAEHCGVSIDWLLTGRRAWGSVPHLNDPLTMSHIGLDHEWVADSMGVDVFNLRYLDTNGGNTSYLIDVSVAGGLGASGKYVFDMNGKPTVCDCKTRVDGSIVIDGDSYSGDLPKPIGRVVGIFTVC